MEQFAGVDDIQVIWDRRNGGVNRRELAAEVAPERRGLERRRPQDRRGSAAEYVVVSVASRVKAPGESR